MMDRDQLQGKNKQLYMLFIGFISILLLANMAPALAHSVSVWAEFKSNKVEVKAYGSDGRQLKKGRIVVKSLNGKPVIEGQMGKNGLFTFVPIRKQDLVITVFLDHNHKGEFWLTEEDFFVMRNCYYDEQHDFVPSCIGGYETVP